MSVNADITIRRSIKTLSSKKIVQSSRKIIHEHKTKIKPDADIVVQKIKKKIQIQKTKSLQSINKLWDKKKKNTYKEK